MYLERMRDSLLATATIPLREPSSFIARVVRAFFKEYVDIEELKRNIEIPEGVELELNTRRPGIVLRTKLYETGEKLINKVNTFLNLVEEIVKKVKEKDKILLQGVGN